MKVISDEILTKLADAIRQKTGIAEKMTPAQMIDAINSIETGASPKVYSAVKSSTGTDATSIEFTGLGGAPVAFSVILTSQYTTASRYCITSCSCNGTNIYNTTRYSRSSGTDYTYVGTKFTWKYNNGTLTITSPSNNSSGGVWCGGNYRLIATY